MNIFEDISNGFKFRLSYFLEKLYIFSKVKDTKSKANEILTEAEITAQSEMIKRTLTERQKKIDNDLTPQNNMRQAKDLTRQGVYKTLANRKNKEKSKGNTFIK